MSKTFETEVKINTVLDKNSLDKVKTSLNGVGKGFSGSIDANTGKVGKSSKRLGTTMRDGVMLGMGNIALQIGTQVASSAIDGIKKMDRYKRTLEKNLGDSVNLDALEKKAEGIFMGSKFSKTDAFEALTYASDNAVDQFDEIKDSMKDIMDLANATGSSLTEATERFVKVRKMSKDTSGKQLVDMLVATGEEVGITKGQLDNILDKVSTTAQANNVNLEELLGITKSLKAVGVEGRKLPFNVENMLKVIYDPKNKGSFVDGSLKDKVMFYVKKQEQADKKGTGAKSFGMMKEKFGDDFANMIKTMAKQSELVETRIKDLTVGEYTGRAEVIGKKMDASIESQLIKITALFKDLAVALLPLVESVLPLLTWAVRGLTNVVKTLVNWMKKMGDGFSKISNFTGRLFGLNKEKKENTFWGTNKKPETVTATQTKQGAVRGIIDKIKERGAMSSMFSSTTPNLAKTGNLTSPKTTLNNTIYVDGKKIPTQAIQAKTGSTSNKTQKLTYTPVPRSATGLSNI